MDDDLRWVISDVLANRHEWWVPGKIVDARGRLAQYWRQPGATRDLLMLDIALDDWFRTQFEKADVRSLDGDAVMEMVRLSLRNTLLSAESDDLGKCLAQWDALASSSERWSQDWSLRALAAVQRTQLSLAAFGDSIYTQCQPVAEAFQAKCGLDGAFVANFGEEVVRGLPAFALSGLLQALEPGVRAAAGVSPWQLSSAGVPPFGARLLAVPSLADVQGTSYGEPTLLLAEHVGGMEDIPTGVVGVLTRSLTDVLSHVAIRARCARALLATCHDEADWGALSALAAGGGATGTGVVVDVSASGAVVVEAGSAPGAGGNGNGNGAPAPGELRLDPVTMSHDGFPWALPESAFEAGRVGKKSLNLKTLRERLAGGGGAPAVPACAALPYGTFERVLGANPGAAAELDGVLRSLEGLGGGGGPLPMDQVGAQLARARAVVESQLTAPPGFMDEVANVAAGAGVIASPAAWAAGPGRDAAWAAICGVWASKWTDRAWLSRRQRGVRDDELRMSVLLQQVVPARYAFVLHTADPLTADGTTSVGELVLGMGEALVGAHPGRALSFSAPADRPGEAAVTGYPSKRVSLHAPPAGTCIARSDANGEDLAGFAGAGLYDSVPFEPFSERPADYASEPLLHDGGARAGLLASLVTLGSTVKGAFDGAHQDVEGVVDDAGKVYVVQARPQVMHSR